MEIQSHLLRDSLRTSSIEHLFSMLDSECLHHKLVLSFAFEKAQVNVRPSWKFEPIVPRLLGN